MMRNVHKKKNEQVGWVLWLWSSSSSSSVNLVLPLLIDYHALFMNIFIIPTSALC
jgi:hypothetical protein